MGAASPGSPGYPETGSGWDPRGESPEAGAGGTARRRGAGGQGGRGPRGLREGWRREPHCRGGAVERRQGGGSEGGGEWGWGGGGEGTRGGARGKGGYCLEEKGDVGPGGVSVSEGKGGAGGSLSQRRLTTAIRKHEGQITGKGKHSEQNSYEKIHHVNERERDSIKEQSKKAEIDWRRFLVSTNYLVPGTLPNINSRQGAITHSGIRGHNEKASSENRGGFKELLRYQARTYEVLSDHLTNSSAFRGDSKMIQNDIIEVVAEV
ncbi:hypothetical protein ACHWQZ_G015661 [Mnemiopsis leidyi]